jgi:phosphatidylglycerophosphate synthase
MTDLHDRRIVLIDLRDHDGAQSDRGALARVCGLPILIRNLLVLQRAGIRTAVIVTTAASAPTIRAAIGFDRRLTMGLEVSEKPLHEAVATADVAGLEILFWPGTVSCGRLAPAIIGTAVEHGHAVVEETRDGRAERALLLFGVGSLDGQADSSPANAVERLSRDGLVTRLERSPHLVAVDSPEDRRTAEATLLNSLRKKEDGALAKYDRAISLAISSRLMRFPVTPNHATIVAGLIGLTSGFLASRGGALWLLAGALCYLASNIVDGIDGELARAKLLESRLGQWLDTLSDDATNLTFWVGTAIGCYRTWHDPTSLVLGAVIAVGIVIDAAIMYHYLITVAHSGDLNAMRWPWEETTPRAGPPPTPGVLDRLKFLLRRDTVGWAVVLAAALRGSWLILWLSAAGATILWVLWLVYTVVPGLDRRS